MPASGGLPRRHVMMISVFERFVSDAKKKGDVVLAEALEHCIMNMSGGNLNCPLGELILEASLRLEKPLGAYLPPPPPSVSMPAPPPPLDTNTMVRKAIEQRETVLKMWSLLETEARQRGDMNLLETLRTCTAITDQHACPIHVLAENALRGHPEQRSPGSDAPGETR